MNQTFDFIIDFHHRPKVKDLADVALNYCTNRVLAVDAHPRVTIELFDAQREALILHVDGEHLGFDFLSLLEDIKGVLRFRGPGEVRHMDKSVDTLFDAHKDAEVGNVPDLRANDGSLGVTLAERFPGVLLHLLHAQ